MGGFKIRRATDVPKLRLDSILLLAAKFIIAIVILSLASYGVHYVAYEVLAYSLAAATCTIAICIYLVISQRCLVRIYHDYAAATMHCIMLLFWIVDLGLVARLAKRWELPSCEYNSRAGYRCEAWQKRSVVPDDGEDSTPYRTFYSALVVGALLAGSKVVLWAVSSYLLYRRRFRKVTSRLSDTEKNSTLTEAVHIPPPHAHTGPAPIPYIPDWNSAHHIFDHPRSGPEPLLPPSPILEAREPDIEQPRHHFSVTNPDPEGSVVSTPPPPPPPPKQTESCSKQLQPFRLSVGSLLDHLHFGSGDRIVVRGPTVVRAKAVSYVGEDEMQEAVMTH